jgi:hypothetical protein
MPTMRFMKRLVTTTLQNLFRSKMTLLMIRAPVPCSEAAAITIVSLFLTRKCVMMKILKLSLAVHLKLISTSILTVPTVHLMTNPT